VQEKNNEILEITAEKYLINRSMIKVAVASSSGRVKACRVHNLLHDLAISLTENGKFLSFIMIDVQVLVLSASHCRHPMCHSAKNARKYYDLFSCSAVVHLLY
jgi:hypothetical protein